MDPNLFFPAPTLPLPPPPLDSLLVAIVNDKHTTSIPIYNPLTHNNVPDNPLAREAIFGLHHVRDALFTPFSSSDQIFPQEDFLRLLNEVFSAAHEGLHLNHLSSSRAFDDLMANEEGLASQVYEVLSNLKDFFQDNSSGYDSEVNPTISRVHCSRCVCSANLSPPSDALSSVRLTSALDVQAARMTLLNKALPSIHLQVAEWSASQCQALIDFLISLITASPSSDSLAAPLSQSLFSLDDHLKTWASSLQVSLRSYTITTMAYETCQETIDLQAKEMIDLAIAAKHREVDAEVQAKFNRHSQWQQSLTQL